MARATPKPESQPAPYPPDELDPVVADHLSEILDEADENAAEDSSIVEYDAEPPEASLIEDVATVLIEMMQAAAASANAGTYAEWALKVIAVVRKAAPAQPADADTREN